MLRFSIFRGNCTPLVYRTEHGRCAAEDLALSHIPLIPGGDPSYLLPPPPSHRLSTRSPAHPRSMRQPLQPRAITPAPYLPADPASLSASSLFTSMGSMAVPPAPEPQSRRPRPDDPELRRTTSAWQRPTSILQPHSGAEQPARENARRSLENRPKPMSFHEPPEHDPLHETQASRVKPEAPHVIRRSRSSRRFSTAREARARRSLSIMRWREGQSDAPLAPDADREKLHARNRLQFWRRKRRMAAGSGREMSASANISNVLEELSDEDLLSATPQRSRASLQYDRMRVDRLSDASIHVAPGQSSSKGAHWGKSSRWRLRREGLKSQEKVGVRESQKLSMSNAIDPQQGPARFKTNLSKYGSRRASLDNDPPDFPGREPNPVVSPITKSNKNNPANSPRFKVIPSKRTCGLPNIDSTNIPRVNDSTPSRIPRPQAFVRTSTRPSKTSVARKLFEEATDDTPRSVSLTASADAEEAVLIDEGQFWDSITTLNDDEVSLSSKEGSSGKSARTSIESGTPTIESTADETSGKLAQGQRSFRTVSFQAGDMRTETDASGRGSSMSYKEDGNGTPWHSNNSSRKLVHSTPQLSSPSNEVVHEEKVCPDGLTSKKSERRSLEKERLERYLAEMKDDELEELLKKRKTSRSLSRYMQKALSPHVK